MTDERCKQILYNLRFVVEKEYYSDDVEEALDRAIEAIEAQPSEDCISRQQALDCFEQTNTRQGAKYAIETLPSVTPQRPKGKWIPAPMIVYGYPLNCTCSECGKKVINTDNFCPSCGSYNGGGEDADSD